MKHRPYLSRMTATVVAIGMLAVASGLTAADTKNGFDVSDALVPAKQIFWGGVARDGIPSINKPNFVAAGDAQFLRSGDRVLGVHRNGIAKAYPIRIMDRHEVVNDHFDDQPVTVTYCPLCFSGMTFIREAGQSALTFGVSGLLYNSDVLLYDHQTGSLWSQLMAKAVSGPFKGTGITPIPTANTTWRNWQERFPETLVLSPDTGFPIVYRDSVYKDYQRSSRLMFPVSAKNRSYRNKDLVLGVILDDTSKAYPFRELRKNDKTEFDDTIGGESIRIQWDDDEEYARAVDVDGNEITTVIVYWFAWYAFHPQTDIYQAGSG